MLNFNNIKEAISPIRIVYVVENFFTKCLMLPMNVFVSDEDIFYICDSIKRFYK